MFQFYYYNYNRGYYPKFLVRKINYHTNRLPIINICAGGSSNLNGQVELMLNRMMSSNDGKGMWRPLESSEDIRLKHFLAFDLSDEELRRVQYRRDNEEIIEVAEVKGTDV